MSDYFKCPTCGCTFNPLYSRRKVKCMNCHESFAAVSSTRVPVDVAPAPQSATRGYPIQHPLPAQRPKHELTIWSERKQDISLQLVASNVLEVLDISGQHLGVCFEYANGQALTSGHVALSPWSHGLLEYRPAFVVRKGYWYPIRSYHLISGLDCALLTFQQSAERRTEEKLLSASQPGNHGVFFTFRQYGNETKLAYFIFENRNNFVSPFRMELLAAATCPGDSGGVVATYYERFGYRVTAVHQGMACCLSINEILHSSRRATSTEMYRSLYRATFNLSQSRVEWSSLYLQPGAVVEEVRQPASISLPEWLAEKGCGRIDGNGQAVLDFCMEHLVEFLRVEGLDVSVLKGYYAFFGVSPARTIHETRGNVTLQLPLPRAFNRGHANRFKRHFDNDVNYVRLLCVLFYVAMARSGGTFVPGGPQEFNDRQCIHEDQMCTKKFANDHIAGNSKKKQVDAAKVRLRRDRNIPAASFIQQQDTAAFRALMNKVKLNRASIWKIGNRIPCLCWNFFLYAAAANKVVTVTRATGAESQEDGMFLGLLEQDGKFYVHHCEAKPEGWIEKDQKVRGLTLKFVYKDIWTAVPEAFR